MRIIRGCSFPVSLSLLPRVYRLSNFVHRTILPCCILPPQIQSNRAMSEVQTTKESCLRMHSFGMHSLCAGRDQRLTQVSSSATIDLCFRDKVSPQTWSSLIGQGDWPVNTRNPSIPRPYPTLPPEVTDPTLVLWIRTRVHAYAYLLAPNTLFYWVMFNFWLLRFGTVKYR